MGEKEIPLKSIVEEVKKTSNQKIDIFGNPEEKINSIEYDSRKVSGKGTAFVAIKGQNHDGHKFIKELFYTKGCAVFFTERYFYNEVKNLDMSFVKKSTFVVVDDTREILGHVARAFYGQKSKIIGVTGTKGKSSTVKIISESLALNGIKSGVLGSIWWKLTTPESLDTLRLISNSNFEYMVMEVTSVSADQKRIEGIDFPIGVFTGLGRDHLDIHKTQEAYFYAKMKFLRKVSGTVVVRLDEWGRKAEQELKREGKNVITFDDDFEWDSVKKTFIINWRGEKIIFKSKFIGSFNGYNFLASYIVLRELGLSPSEIKDAFEIVNPPKGRMELVHEKPDVFVDYAHTPDSLYSVLKEMINLKKASEIQRKIIVVFGCGGMRDKGKRPEMGKIASELADKVVITSDNPRGEDPIKIIEDILQGIDGDRLKNSSVLVEPDRRKAIFLSLEMAGENDIVVIAGKGHEEYQIIGDKIIPFSDRKVVEEFFRSRSIR